MSGYSVMKCTKCGAGLVMGFTSDSYIMSKDMKRMESERDRIIGGQ